MGRETEAGEGRDLGTGEGEAEITPPRSEDEYDPGQAHSASEGSHSRRFVLFCAGDGAVLRQAIGSEDAEIGRAGDAHEGTHASREPSEASVTPPRSEVRRPALTDGIWREVKNSFPPAQIQILDYFVNFDSCVYFCQGEDEAFLAAADPDPTHNLGLRGNDAHNSSPSGPGAGVEAGVRAGVGLPAKSPLISSPRTRAQQAGRLDSRKTHTPARGNRRRSRSPNTQNEFSPGEAGVFSRTCTSSSGEDAPARPGRPTPGSAAAAAAAAAAAGTAALPGSRAYRRLAQVERRARAHKPSDSEASQSDAPRVDALDSDPDPAERPFAGTQGSPTPASGAGEAFETGGETGGGRAQLSLHALGSLALTSKQLHHEHSQQPERLAVSPEGSARGDTSGLAPTERGGGGSRLGWELNPPYNWLGYRVSERGGVSALQEALARAARKQILDSRRVHYWLRRFWATLGNSPPAAGRSVRQAAPLSGLTRRRFFAVGICAGWPRRPAERGVCGVWCVVCVCSTR